MDSFNLVIIALIIYILTVKKEGVSMFPHGIKRIPAGGDSKGSANPPYEAEKAKKRATERVRRMLDESSRNEWWIL